jgi:hypothetical protein
LPVKLNLQSAAKLDIPDAANEASNGAKEASDATNEMSDAEAPSQPDFRLPASAGCFPTLRLCVSVAVFASAFLAMRGVCAGNLPASILRLPPTPLEFPFLKSRCRYAVALLI